MLNSCGIELQFDEKSKVCIFDKNMSPVQRYNLASRSRNLIGVCVTLHPPRIEVAASMPQYMLDYCKIWHT
jgi:hypothetical protein